LTLIQKEVYLRTRRKIPAESATFLGAIGIFLGGFILFLEEQSSAFSRTFTRFFSAERLFSALTAAKVNEEIPIPSGKGAEQ
jgi:hypothetical protein